MAAKEIPEENIPKVFPFMYKDSGYRNVLDLGDGAVTSLSELKAVKARENEKAAPWKEIDVEKFEQGPYEYIQSLFDKKNLMVRDLPLMVWEDDVLKELQLVYTKRRFDDESGKKILSLNDPNTVKVRNGQVVRFRCMIQDDGCQEYSLPEYKEKNPLTGKLKTYTTLLQTVDVQMDQADEHRFFLSEKDVYVGISPPGETAWMAQDCSDDLKLETETKRVKLDETEGRSQVVTLPDYKAMMPYLFQHPGDTKTIACILKFYKDDDFPIKHNLTYEVIGLIRFPELESAAAAEPMSEFDYGFSTERPDVQKLPAIHVFAKFELPGGNPSLPILEGKPFPLFSLTKFQNEMVENACALRTLFALSTCCDIYAGTHAMMALTAKMHHNEDGTVRGKMVTNIYGLGHQHDVDLLYYVIKSLFPRAVRLNFTAADLSNAEFVPTKNLATDQLEPGFLQLPVGTPILIDETRLEECRFDEKACRNLQALESLLKNQKVEYDYKYHYPEMDARFPVIIVSKGPSVLSHDVRIMVSPLTQVTPEARRSGVDQILNDKAEQLRQFIAIHLVREIPLDLFDPTDETLEKDWLNYMWNRNKFVALPSNESYIFQKRMTAADLAAFLSSCRCWALLHGDNAIRRDTFELWKHIDRVRDKRDYNVRNHFEKKQIKLSR